MLHRTWNFDADSTSEFDQRAVTHPRWSGQQHFIAAAWLDHCLQCHIHRMLCANCHCHIFGAALNAVFFSQLFCNRFARWLITSSWCVLRHSRFERLDCSALDRKRRIEIRFAHCETDHVDSLRFQCSRTRSYGKSCGFLHFGDAAGNLHS